MSVAEAGPLPEKELGQAGEDKKTLVQALSCTPLAITQAASYIRERAPRCSVEGYCGDLRALPDVADESAIARRASSES